MTAAAAVDMLPVSEVFGPTLQGEGPSAGRLAAFLRLGGCNLTCRDCDTPYTWDGRRFDLRAELNPLTAQQILGRLPPAPLVVVTGGEPTLYRDRPALHAVLDRLTGRRVEVETNGTINPAPLDRWPHVRFNVSPKLAGPMSDDPADRRLVPAALARYADLARAGRAVWKLVVDGPAAVDQAVTLADDYGVPRRRLWLMPAGTTPDGILDTARAVAAPAIAAGANLTLRQHILLWSDARGR